MFRLSMAIYPALLLILPASACGEDAVALTSRSGRQVVHGPGFDETEVRRLDRSGVEAERKSIVEGIPINSGAVLIRGRKLNAPFVVSRDQGLVMVNGEPVSQEMPESSDGGKRLAARMERQLFDNRWLVVFDQGIVAYGSEESTMMLMGNLAQAGDVSEKIRHVMNATLEGLDDVTSGELNSALNAFEPDSDLVRQFELYQSEMSSMSEAAEDSVESELQVHDSTRTMYGLSVVGMLLIALSTGTLLGHPPKAAARWSRIIRSPRTLSAVQRCLLLIAAYSVFDLAATLLAVRTGHVEELNPFGEGLVFAPAALAAFKVAATGLGMGLLWRLRNYHGAQLASWWLCLVLTLVTVRWVTVQSLFFV